MKEIVVISGKGGTGKTVLTASLAVLAESKVMADCDVDAADLHLLLRPRIVKRREFRSGRTAVVDREKCIGCGRCLALCRFEAVKTIKNEAGGPERMEIDPVSCEGCGACYHGCPVDAVEMVENLSGETFVSDTEYGPLIHARLGIGEENSGKLVTEVKRLAKETAAEQGRKYVIVDGPPGVGCPVIASLAGADAVLVVTEPTLSGMHDLERVVRLVRHFGIKTYLCINKFDLNSDNASAIEKYAEGNGLEAVGKIPYDERVMESVVRGVPLPEFLEGEIPEMLFRLWGRLGG